MFSFLFFSFFEPFLRFLYKCKPSGRCSGERKKEKKLSFLDRILTSDLQMSVTEISPLSQPATDVLLNKYTQFARCRAKKKQPSYWAVLSCVLNEYVGLKSLWFLFYSELSRVVRHQSSGIGSRNHLSPRYSPSTGMARPLTHMRKICGQRRTCKRKSDLEGAVNYKLKRKVVARTEMMLLLPLNRWSGSPKVSLRTEECFMSSVWLGCVSWEWKKVIFLNNR